MLLTHKPCLQYEKWGRVNVKNQVTQTLQLQGAGVKQPTTSRKKRLQVSEMLFQKTKRMKMHM